MIKPNEQSYVEPGAPLPEQNEGGGRDGPRDGRSCGEACTESPHMKSWILSVAFWFLIACKIASAV